MSRNAAQAVLALGIATAFALTAGSAAAQSFPVKPVRMIVAFPPGGGADVFGRVLAPKLAEIWGQPVVVENRPGASAMIGMDAVAKAPPDGYTIGIITLTHAINATLFPKAPYSLLKDIAPVSISVHSPMLVVTHPSVPATTLGDLTALLRTRKLSAPSSGNGSPPHIGLELYKQLGGFQAVHVTYKGGAPSMIDLVGGQTDFAVSNLVESIQHVKAGKLRPIAIPSETRHPQLPDVPTTAEAGMPAFRLSNWVGVVTGAGVPVEIQQALSDAVERAVRSPEISRKLVDLALTPAAMPMTEARRHVETEVGRWGELIRNANIQPD